MMTLQQVLDRNWQWFIVQRHRPGMDMRRQLCIYSGTHADGTDCRCAIGCCLPDDIGPLDNSVHVDALIFHHQGVNDVFGGLDRQERQALLELQQGHDRAAIGSHLYGYDFHDDYELFLRDWAGDHGLDCPTPADARLVAA